MSNKLIDIILTKFYNLYIMDKGGDTMLTVKVCVGSACYVKGSHDVINRIKYLIEENNLQNEVELKAAFCLGHCLESVCVMVNEDFHSLTKDDIDIFFNTYIKEKLM